MFARSAGAGVRGRGLGILVATLALAATIVPVAAAAAPPGAGEPPAGTAAPFLVSSSALATPGASIAEDATDTTPSHYYACDGTGAQPPRQSGRLDANGVLMSRFGGRWVYHPVNMQLWALSLYESYLHTGNATERETFLNTARFQRDRMMDAEGRFPYLFSARGLRTPWYSAMAQGLGMSVFARAWVETGDESFRQAALRALRPLTVPVGAGGVVTDTGTDLWLEEYPDRSKVLNGSMFAIWGVWDVVRISDDATARSIYTRSVDTLRRHLTDYERGDCILYQLTPASWAYNYHGLHIDMLGAMTLITGDPYWAATGERWRLHFRPYPRPTIRLAGRGSMRVRSGQRATLRGTVRPLAKAATMRVWMRGPDGVERYQGAFTVRAAKRRSASAFRWRTPPVTSPTTFIVELDWQKDTHTEIVVIPR